MEQHLYTFEDGDGNKHDWSTTDYNEAKHFADVNDFLVIDNTFTWEDSEPVNDFRPTPHDWVDHGLHHDQSFTDTSSLDGWDESFLGFGKTRCDAADNALEAAAEGPVCCTEWDVSRVGNPFISTPVSDRDDFFYYVTLRLRKREEGT